MDEDLDNLAQRYALTCNIKLGERLGFGIHGTVFADDKVVPPEFSEEILCYQPSAQIVTIPGDHFALWKNAACWAEAITRFAQGFAGSRPEGDLSTVTEAPKQTPNVQRSTSNET